ncbi:MAG: murein biosynthesis integral membrane protein MurJ [Thermotogaceae bacterium]|nr:murein biosynthesis integral membrane protein MurJ [Thermotogaceae bacterium]
MSVLAGSIAFSVATFISRIFGLARDVTLAAIYGASGVLDAYLVSIIFPFFLRKIFGEGALGSSFVPFYKSVEDRDGFVSSVINTFLIITFAIVVIVEIFPGIVSSVFAVGYNVEGKEQIERLVRITVLFVPEIFLWAVFYSILNSHDKFFLPALSPFLMNVGVIVGTLAGKDVFWSAVGFVLGGLAAAIALGVKAVKYFNYKFVFNKMKGFWKAFSQATLAMMANQLNLLVDVNVASFLGYGSISFLQLASRLYQLPLGLFSVAVSTVALSKMSGKEKKEKEMKDAVETVLLFTLPSFLGLFILSKDLIYLIYGYGKFDEFAVLNTAKVLAMYSIGIVPYSLYYIALRYHHSSKRMSIPLYASILVTSTNGVLDVILGRIMGASGIALATSIAGMVGSVFFLLRKEISVLYKENLKIVLSSAVMGAMLYLARPLGNSRLFTLFLVLIAASVYFLTLISLNSEKAKEVYRFIRR